jgi:hypothetical protein
MPGFRCIAQDRLQERTENNSRIFSIAIAAWSAKIAGVKLHRSTIAACFVFLRKISRTAIWDFCNRTGAYRSFAKYPLRAKRAHSKPPIDDFVNQQTDSTANKPNPVRTTKLPVKIF